MERSSPEILMEQGAPVGGAGMGSEMENGGISG